MACVFMKKVSSLQNSNLAIYRKNDNEIAHLATLAQHSNLLGGGRGGGGGRGIGLLKRGRGKEKRPTTVLREGVAREHGNTPIPTVRILEEEEEEEEDEEEQEQEEEEEKDFFLL